MDLFVLVKPEKHLEHFSIELIFALLFERGGRIAR
jgi:hypothetical protein